MFPHGEDREDRVKALRPDRLNHLQCQEGIYCTIKGFMSVSTYCTDVLQQKHHHPAAQTGTLTPPKHKSRNVVIPLIGTKSLISYTHTHRHSPSTACTTASVEGVRWDQVLWALTWLTEVWMAHAELTVSWIWTEHQRTRSKLLPMYWSLLLDSEILWRFLPVSLHLFYNIYRYIYIYFLNLYTHTCSTRNHK